MKTPWCLFFAGVLILLSVQGIVAQEESKENPVTILKLQGKFTFDGITDDESWRNATRLPATMMVPVFGKSPTQETEFLITYDDKYVYLAGNMYDKTPEKILATSRIRDEWSPQNDYLIWVFDTFDDNENGLIFATTPEGVRVDAAVINDAVDINTPYSKDWNTFWDVKTSRNEKGWFAEIRIPVSSLRFQSVNGEVTMGLIALRYRPESSEIDIFPAIPDKWSGVSWMKVSQAGHVIFKGMKVEKPFYIAPYATGGINQESELAENDNVRVFRTNPKINGGLDLKYGITQNLTADITLNTDFAQVEADQAQINLTRFDLFFPEKRTFFLERSSNFSFAFDDKNNLFYSRRIGLADEQYPVPIYEGARLVGRTGKWDVGFMEMQTHSFRHPSDTLKDLPGENFGVLRLRRQVLNSNSYAGGIVTSRIGTDGSYNIACGLDGILKLPGDNYLDVKMVQTFDNTYESRVKWSDKSRIWLDLNNRKQRGLGYDINAGYAGELYQPECGYEQRSDFKKIGSSLLYGWLAKPESHIYGHRFTVGGKQWTQNRTNTVQTRLLSADYFLGMKNSASFDLMFNNSTEHISDSFRIMRSATVPPGDYNYNYFTSVLNSAAGKRYYLESHLNIGQFYDGSLISIYLMGNYSFTTGFRIEGFYEYDRVRFPSRYETANGHIAGLKTIFMFSTKLSFTAYIQYSKAENSVLSNLRFRYNPREGNDFYIVFNEGRNTFLHSEFPPLRRIESRAIILKYTYTFVL